MENSIHGRARLALEELTRHRVEKKETRERKRKVAAYATKVAKSGSWRVEGSITTYSEGLIGSAREYPHTYVGTEFVLVDSEDDKPRRVAIRELPSEGPSGQVNLGLELMVGKLEARSTKSEVIATITPDGASINLADIGEAGDDELTWVEGLLAHIDASDQK